MLPISIGVSSQAAAGPAPFSATISNLGPPEVPLFQQGVCYRLTRKEQQINKVMIVDK